MISDLLRRLVAATLASLLLSGCRSKPSTAPGFPDGHTRVLFIGNSLTYTNSLPAMYIALARLAGHDSVDASQIAFPDFGLEDHWADGSARRSLASNRWEFVIMQQGSSALPASQVNLRTWSEQFAPLVRAAGAEPVLFMVWPSSTRVFDFPNVLQSYRDAAASINGIFAPAGDGWTAHGALESLYSDALHPSTRGTYIAAVVLLERTLGLQPEQLPATVPGSPAITEVEVRTMQQAARVALQRNVSRPSNRQTPE